MNPLYALPIVAYAIATFIVVVVYTDFVLKHRKTDSQVSDGDVMAAAMAIETTSF